MLTKVLSKIIIFVNLLFGIHTVLTKNGTFTVKGFSKIYSFILVIFLIISTLYFYGPSVISIIFNREKLIWMVMYLHLLTVPVNAALSLIIQMRTSSKLKIKAYENLIINENMKIFIMKKETEISDRSRCIYFFFFIINIIKSTDKLGFNEIINILSNHIIEMSILQFFIDTKLAVLSLQYMNTKFMTLFHHEMGVDFERTSISIISPNIDVKKYEEVENKYDIILSHLNTYNILEESIKLMLSKIMVIVSIIHCVTNLLLINLKEVVVFVLIKKKKTHLSVRTKSGINNILRQL